MHSFSKIKRRQLVIPNLSTCTHAVHQLANHYCNSSTAQQLLVVPNMDYAIHLIEWISIGKTNCTIHWIMFCLDGYSVIQQLAPAVNNNETSHLKVNCWCVFQVVTPWFP